LSSGKISLSQLNIFIGSNGSGKSNFINCLKFLKNCLTTTDDNRGVSSFEDAVTELGRERILDITVDSPAKVKLAYCFANSDSDSSLKKSSKVLDFKLDIVRQGAISTIAEEALYSGEELQEIREDSPFYYYRFHDREIGKGVVSVYDNPESTQTHFETFYNIRNEVFGLGAIYRLLEDSKFSPEMTPIYRVQREIFEEIKQWQFYNANNMNLQKIRNSEPKIGPNDRYLSSEGDNLPLVLDNLSQDIDFEDNINIAMRSILPTTRRIRAARSGRLSLTVEWYFEGTNEPFYLSEMSDGTVRMLCWAIILHSPFLPSLLVIDEPELGLHVAWMRILAEWIKKAANRTQIIVTTHSPDLLDHFTDSIENVFCFSLENSTHFSVHSLSPQKLQPQLEEGWELGDLYRVGDPIIGGWPW
ncbi:MAG: AAA family ATPase, partial [Jaaginema sp. PMC 1079.18]|nr:AAA family ATPase [Jaaginema sp. PMC 1079.18]